MAATAELLISRITDREAHDLEAVLRYGLRSARPAQIPPESGWDVLLALAGRGGGKTWTGASWFVRRARRLPGGVGALVARTAADVRDTMVYGESGIMSRCPPWFRPQHRKTDRCLLFPNGFQAHLYSAEEPDLIRGPNFHVAWGDEFATWRRIRDGRGADAWSNLQDALRLGLEPQVLLTTTPRPTDLVMDTALGPRDGRTGKRLVATKDMESHEWWLRQHTKDHRGRDFVHRTLVRRWRTEENVVNLSPGFAAKRRARYGDSPLGHQELDAEILVGNDLALWAQETIDFYRLEAMDSERERLVVAIDPTRSPLRPRDEAGIIVAARGKNGHGYVLEDGTVRGSPFDWATRALALGNQWQADDILYESNRLDQSILDTLRVVARASPGLNWVPRQSQGDKKSRAEPVSASYRAGKVHHVNRRGKDGDYETFEFLEHEMVTWDPSDPNSPNRLDALVIALTDLMLVDRKRHKAVGPRTLGSRARR